MNSYPNRFRREYVQVRFQIEFNRFETTIVLNLDVIKNHGLIFVFFSTSAAISVFVFRREAAQGFSLGFQPQEN